MELNLLSFVIYSLNILTIASNFVYSSALINDKEVNEANSTVKWNITEVKEPDLEEQEKEDVGDKVKVPKDERIATSDGNDTDKRPEVPLSILAQLPEFDPCIPSKECPLYYWPWCEVINGTVRCICILEYYRSRPIGICKPTCTIDSECDAYKSCIDSQCVDPCPGPCGTNAKCDVIDHTLICWCPPGYSGNPFDRCRVTRTPCAPSPCGPYSQCKEINGIAACRCLLNSIGSPPSCIQKCTNNSECNEAMACINNRCSDPCPACGNDAQCSVHNHIPYCSCWLQADGRPLEEVTCQILHEAMDSTFGYKQYPIMGPKFDPTDRASSLLGLKTERDFLEWKKKNSWPYNIPLPPYCVIDCALSAFRGSFCPVSERLNGHCVKTDE